MGKSGVLQSMGLQIIEYYTATEQLSGAALGITDKMEAWPRDEGVRPCDSDLFFPFFS